MALDGLTTWCAWCLPKIIVPLQWRRDPARPNHLDAHCPHCGLDEIHAESALAERVAYERRRQRGEPAR
jgi:hypothetical protein